jgi:hypothetical protein
MSESLNSKLSVLSLISVAVTVFSSRRFYESLTLRTLSL